MRSTSANVGEGPAEAGRMRLPDACVLAAVTRSSIARIPPSAPARSIPWIESERA
ncbi:MAG TPA: hypothetical protein VF520_03595 [Thermoleophilaceae bacterium]